MIFKIPTCNLRTWFARNTPLMGRRMRMTTTPAKAEGPMVLYISMKVACVKNHKQSWILYHDFLRILSSKIDTGNFAAIVIFTNPKLILFFTNPKPFICWTWQNNFEPGKIIYLFNIIIVCSNKKSLVFFLFFPIHLIRRIRWIQLEPVKHD